MPLRADVVEVDPAIRADSGTVRTTEKLLGEPQRDRVVEPPSKVEKAVVHIGALELRITSAGMVDLPALDRDPQGRRLQTPHAGPDDRHLGEQPQREPGTGTGDLHTGLDPIVLEPQLDAANDGRRRLYPCADHLPLSAAQAEQIEIDRSAFHILRG